MQFVDTTTPQTSRDYRDAVWGSRNTLSDAAFQASHDWATMYYQNAYNTAIMNYMNEYNKPLNQMLRYQEAGISPWLAAGQANPGNMDSSHAGAAPKGSFTAPNSAQRQAAAVQTLNSINQVVESAAQFYDYVKYGRKTHAQDLMNTTLQGTILGTQLRRHAAEADWAEYWNYPADSDVTAPSAGSPRANYMQMSYQQKAAQVAQLESLVDTLYPSQVAANEARAALQEYQKQVLEGKNDAILDLNTGYPQVDAWLKVILMMLSNTSLGLSGKMF